MALFRCELKNVESRPDEAIKVEYTCSGETVTSYLKTDKDQIDHRGDFMVRSGDTNVFQVSTFVEGRSHCRSHWDWRCYTAPCESLGEFGDRLGFHPKTSMVPLSEVPVDYDEARYEDEKVFTAAETEQAPEEEGDQAEEK
ncbi:hypothetical protein B9479_004172 [Cryptococcus floricola]|uniref:Uncharacterized protein n=1 Tax=Cryptococcus floricola TaxID=2591691 RepID=A0A5D3AUU0_9TREE|nr:hypothetical protein B9479_004172 [Cryptococcus floricola]